MGIMSSRRAQLAALEIGQTIKVGDTINIHTCAKQVGVRIKVRENPEGFGFFVTRLDPSKSQE